MYDLPTVNYTKKLREIKNQFLIAPLSPGMQEQVADHREKLRNTCIISVQIVYYTIKKRGHIVNPYKTPFMLQLHDYCYIFRSTP
jgi:hypothetical protein